MSAEVLEAQIRLVMDRLSNGDPVEVREEDIQEAVAQYEALLRRIFNRGNDKFRIRMSNIGRPLCQLQLEKAGVDRARMPYESVLKFHTGDIHEVFIELMCKVAGVNITGGKSQAKLDVAGVTVSGEDDIEIDNKVFDTKSSSPWAFENKWGNGWGVIKSEDNFGYVAQLLGYSDGLGLAPGGWIVTNKSTGEVKVVEAEFSEEDKEQTRKNIEETVSALVSDTPFYRCFDPEIEYFRRVPTGSKRLATACTFCSFKNNCWPDAVYMPQTGSKAVTPRHYWYSEYSDAVPKS